MAGERFADRDTEIWDLYCNGHTQVSLGVRFGLSNQRISQIIAAFRDAVKPEDKADRVARSLAQLDWMAVELHRLATADPIPAYSNGRPILTGRLLDNGDPEVAEDHSARVTALRELRATNAEVRKLLGTDAKIETSVTVDTSPELAALVATAKARREARRAPEGDAEPE